MSREELDERGSPRRTVRGEGRAFATMLALRKSGAEAWLALAVCARACLPDEQGREHAQWLLRRHPALVLQFISSTPSLHMLYCNTYTAPESHVPPLPWSTTSSRTTIAHMYSGSVRLSFCTLNASKPPASPATTANRGICSVRISTVGEPHCVSRDIVFPISTRTHREDFDRSKHPQQPCADADRHHKPRASLDRLGIGGEPAVSAKPLPHNRGLWCSVVMVVLVRCVHGRCRRASA